MSPAPRNPTVGEYGDPVFVNAGCDLTGRTVVAKMWRPDGTYVFRPCSHTQGSVWETLQTMAPGQWVYFVTEDGDVSQVGNYMIELEITPPPPVPQIPQFSFLAVRA
jgi:hypothetical protein